MENEFLIYSRAPTRISFVGGGTDVDPFPEKYGGAVINASINKYITSLLKLRNDKQITIEIANDCVEKSTYKSIDDLLCSDYTGKSDDIIKAVIKCMCPNLKINQGFDIYVYNDLKPRSGLGGSAAIFLSIIGLFSQLSAAKLDKYACAELAYQLERNELKNLGGRQDQLASAFGGINFIEFKSNDFVRVTPLDLNKACIYELEERSILINLGERKTSGYIIEQQIKNVEAQNDALQYMLKTKELVYAVKEALLEHDLETFGEILDEAWHLKKKFASGISNSTIDSLYEKLKENGAICGKICGAGGGGHMYIFFKPFYKDKIISVVKNFGFEFVPFKFENSGLVTWKSKCHLMF